MKNPIAININYDSLAEALGFPKGFSDPSYFKIFDRVFKLSNQYQIPLSLYVIGKDLENSEVASRIRDISDAGHEIGNHTYSHKMNLGSLSKAEIKFEIEKTHELVSSFTGKEPKGFIAPAWSTSEKVRQCLIDLNYEYDTSLFCSIYLYPMISKIAFNHLKNPKKILKVISRRDWFYPLTRPSKPYLAGKDYQLAKHTEKSILVMPIPTINRFRLPIWHTTGFFTGWGRHMARLNAINSSIDKNLTYYLMHPADFSDNHDISNELCHSLERMDQSISNKMRIIENIFDYLYRERTEFVTMYDLSKKIKIDLKNNIL